MTNPNFFILYVDNPLLSVTFYQSIFNAPPIEAAPTFAMFALPSGVMFGLWSKHTVSPIGDAVGVRSEVAFALDSNDAVDQTYQLWSSKGVVMLQQPIKAEFGYNFVGQDIDGHRLRVFCPS